MKQLNTKEEVISSRKRNYAMRKGFNKKNLKFS